MKLKGNFIIHVNKNMIASAIKNKKYDTPTIIVRNKNKSYYCNGVNFLNIKGILGGPGVLNQLDCGARVYHKVSGEIELINPHSFREAQRICKI